VDQQPETIECHPGESISFGVEAVAHGNTELLGPFRAFLVASSNGLYLPVVKIQLGNLDTVSTQPVTITVTMEIDQACDLGVFKILSLRLVPNDFRDPAKDIYRGKQIQPVVDVDVAMSPLIRVSGTLDDWVGGTATLGIGRFAG